MILRVSTHNTFKWLVFDGGIYSVFDGGIYFAVPFKLHSRKEHCHHDKYGCEIKCETGSWIVVENISCSNHSNSYNFSFYV